MSDVIIDPAKELHEAYKQALVDVGRPDHPFQKPGGPYRNSCIGHYTVKQKNGPSLTKPCTLRPEDHDPDMVAWEELPAKRVQFWRAFERISSETAAAMEEPA